MPDILIRGVKPPKNCSGCSTKIDPDNRQCNFDGHVFEETLSVLTSRRDHDCPLIELPPHGDLIDRGELNKCRKEFCHGKNGWEYYYVEDQDIDAAAVIVPASLAKEAQ